MGDTGEYSKQPYIWPPHSHGVPVITTQTKSPVSQYDYPVNTDTPGNTARVFVARL